MQSCSACSKKGAKLLRCSACQSAWYCDASCQRSHWKRHKLECKKLAQAKVDENMQAAEAELIAADAVRIVVNTPRITITRCADPDDSIYTQTMPGDAINDWLRAHRLGCWCSAVGTWTPSETIFAVAAFTRSQVCALPQPRTEVELSDHTRERGVLESEVIDAFGLRLRVTAAPALGQVSFGLREVAMDPAPPLDTVQGIAVLSTCFVLSGDMAERLELPPPAVHARGERAHAEMKVFCGVGEWLSTISCSDLNSLPRVSQAALNAAPFDARQPSPPEVGEEDLVAIGMFLERCGDAASKDAFEALSIQALVHDAHARQQPEATVPEFARRLAADPRAVASAHARTEHADRGIRVLWMAKGKGM